MGPHRKDRVNRRPKILITLDTSVTFRRGVPFETVEQKTAYADAVIAAGGVPIWISPTSDDEVVNHFLEFCDGLVVTGGYFDISPHAYGMKPSASRLDEIKPLRTNFESQLLQACFYHDRPVLAICGGMQLLNVCCGGTLIQDIESEWPAALEHEQKTSPRHSAHPVELAPQNLIHSLAQKPIIHVNSTHHQALDDLGEGLRVLGRAPDGIIEAIADEEERRIGVQWHPELLDDDLSRGLYRHLIASCRCS